MFISKSLLILENESATLEHVAVDSLELGARGGDPDLLLEELRPLSRSDLVDLHTHWVKIKEANGCLAENELAGCNQLALSLLFRFDPRPLNQIICIVTLQT